MDRLVEAAARYSRRLLRRFAFILGGIAIALFGVVVVSVGIIKWLALYMPSWLAWLIVGVILLLVGAVLVASNK